MVSDGDLMRISWNFTGIDGDILGYHQLLWLMGVPQFMARLMQNMMICSMDLGVPYVKTNPKRKLPPNEDQKGGILTFLKTRPF